MVDFILVNSFVVAIILPYIAAFLVGLVGKKNPNLREIIAIATGLVVTFLVFISLLKFKSGLELKYRVVEIVKNVPIVFKVEPLGLIFALIASFLWVVSTIYSVGYMRGNNEKNQTRFFVCFSLAIGSALGVAFAGNLITLFLFYEIITIATYPLVTHSGTDEAKISGRKYLGILMGVSIMFFLPAILWTYSQTGSVDFASGGILEGHFEGVFVGLLLFLYVYGIGKAALMPIHYWLPAAMVAPTPVSALLHAVAVVKAGVFSVLKIIVYVFGADFLYDQILTNWWAGGWLVYIAGFVILAASIVAIKQDNLKLRLAYSTISQLSYVILATAMLATKSMVAAAFHIAAHAFGKITLFFAAGSIYTASKKKKVSQLDGIGYKMPYTMTAFAIGALSMIAVPPAAGFISKWYMLEGAFNHNLLFVVFVLILSTILNAMYFLPIIYRAFFVKAESDIAHGEAPKTIVLALLITAICTIWLFFSPGIFMDLAQNLAIMR